MKFGIISLGNHATKRVMPAIVNAGHEISAIYSRSMDKATATAGVYGAAPFDDIGDFIACDFESAYISSPNFLHYEHAKKCLEGGKHVLLEKQMTLKNEQAAELVKISDEAGLSLAIGFHVRFHPAVADIRKMVQGGELGDITYVSGMWATLSTGRRTDPDSRWWYEDDKVGGGSVMGMGVHVVDTVNHVLGRTPDSVSAVRVPHGKVIDSTENIGLLYGSVAANAISSRSIASASNDLSVCGTGGTAVGRNVFSGIVKGSLWLNGQKIREYSSGNVYEEEVKSFVELVKGGNSIIARGSDGHLVVRIVNAAFQSDLEGKVVRI